MAANSNWHEQTIRPYRHVQWHFPNTKPQNMLSSCSHIHPESKRKHVYLICAYRNRQTATSRKWQWHIYKIYWTIKLLYCKTCDKWGRCARQAKLMWAIKDVQLERVLRIYSRSNAKLKNDMQEHPLQRLNSKTALYPIQSNQSPTQNRIRTTHGTLVRITNLLTMHMAGMVNGGQLKQKIKNENDRIKSREKRDPWLLEHLWE